jgi:hypothetical protein
MSAEIVGKVPKIFTSEQIHTASLKAVYHMNHDHPGYEQDYLVLKAMCLLMVELGLKTPEDFYE